MKNDLKSTFFDEFYALDYNQQSSKLYCGLELNEPSKRKGNNDDATSRRKCTFRYYLQIYGKRREVW